MFGMAACKFGVALFCAETITQGVKFARMAEEFGYDRLWVGDSHMIWRECRSGNRKRTWFEVSLARLSKKFDRQSSHGFK
jgi:alkanesulfonate monooxygenase SsuD/methylene tetrahydromethanopterin reductase-like flavin-dependent oxidoreductase (luciferase family)